MALDLNAISLDQFNAAASGSQNIGQLKFNSDGTGVYRTNNHKTLTIFNNTKISTYESIAMRHAFCNALAREGLGESAMSAIREKLNVGNSMAENDSSQLLSRSQRAELAKNDPAQYKKLTDSTNANWEWRDRRDSIMDKAVNPVIKALQAARPFDPKNAELVNKIRDFFYGDKTVDYNGETMGPDKLFNEIDKILVAAASKREAAAANDDITENLRIEF